MCQQELEKKVETVVSEEGPRPDGSEVPSEERHVTVAALEAEVREGGREIDRDRDRERHGDSCSSRQFVPQAARSARLTDFLVGVCCLRVVWSLACLEKEGGFACRGVLARM